MFDMRTRMSFSWFLSSLTSIIAFQALFCDCFIILRTRNGVSNACSLSNRKFVYSSSHERTSTISSHYGNYFINFLGSPKSSFKSKIDDDDHIIIETDDLISNLFCHHTAIKTRDIEISMKFYSLFGFEVESKFRAGPARAAWLSHSYSNDKTRNIQSRIELIEVPSYMLQEEKDSSKKSRAIDLMNYEHFLGFNHLALDVTHCINKINNLTNDLKSDGEINTLTQEPSKITSTYGLSDYIEDLNKKSLNLFGKTLRIALTPRQQIIGGSVYEISFLYDADGSLLEILNWLTDLENKDLISSGWEPWDGKGFVGPNQQ